MDRIERISGFSANTHPKAKGWRLATRLTVTLVLAAAGIVRAATSDEDAERPTDELAWVLQDALAAGDLSPEEAREAYFEDVYPGSAAQAKIEGELEMVTAEIDAMVAAGALSTEDADAKSTWLSEQRDRNEETAFAVEVRGLSRSEAYLEQTATTLDAMVERGELSAEDAEAKLRAVEEQVAVKEELARDIANGDRSRTEAYLEQAAAKLDAMVERGELSAEDAEAKLSEYGEQLAFEETLAAKMKAEGKSKAVAYRELVAADIEASSKSGEGAGVVTGAGSAAVMIARGAQSKTDSLDFRTVLSAIRRVDLSGDQKRNIRNIRRQAIVAYRKISRKGKQARTDLAKRVKADIVELLNGKQTEQFGLALKRLDRPSQRGKHRQVTAKSNTDERVSP